MKIINSYIFLPKDDKNEKNQDRNYYVMNDNVPTIFKSLFNTTEESLLLREIQNDQEKVERVIKDLFYKITKGIFDLTIGNEVQQINYKFTGVNSSYYLDIIVDSNSIGKIIPFLERIDNILVNEPNDINKDYIAIKSYDSISEYYCNKIYPYLNKFERKLRKLLYLIYTVQFERDYFKKTTTEEFQKTIKGKIKSKNGNKKKREIDYTQRFFESFDFVELQQLLFEKRWTELDDEEIKVFLDNNKDLTTLSDKQIRNVILNIKPKSDWERFFSNKELADNMEETIKLIAKLRNQVAHNKLFNRKQYEELSILLKDTTETLDKAIKITETEDFIRLNKKRLAKTMKILNNKIFDTMQAIREALLPNKEIINSYMIQLRDLGAAVNKFTSNDKNKK